MAGRERALVVADRIEAKFRELQRVPMPTSEFWKQIAETAIAEVERTLPVVEVVAHEPRSIPRY